jgi:hypothetical protein
MPLHIGHHAAQRLRTEKLIGHAVSSAIREDKEWVEAAILRGETQELNIDPPFFA